MKKHDHNMPPHTSRRLLRIATQGGALASIATATHNAEAAVVAAFGTPIGPPVNGTTYWDVDNDGTNDFILWRWTYSYSGFTYFEANFDDGPVPYGSTGGRLVVGSSFGSDGIAKLSPGFIVGAVMPGFFFHSTAQTSNTITSNGGIGWDAYGSGWAYGDTGLFGFKFESGPNTFYGWGELVIGAGNGFQITQAYYETTPGASITIGDTGLAVVPEPATPALLALGSAGLAAFRRRRQAA